jgi:hypothetical protein
MNRMLTSRIRLRKPDAKKKPPLAGAPLASGGKAWESRMMQNNWISYSVTHLYFITREQKNHHFLDESVASKRKE